MEGLDISYGESGISKNRLRKLKKPLIEKKRRERINKSLTCLKSLLLENIRRNGGTQTSKLDKADILDMAVTYLRMLQYGQSALMNSCQTQYSLGYQDCANEALRYLEESRSHSNDVTAPLSKHLFHKKDILESLSVDDAQGNDDTQMSLNIRIPSTHVQFHQQTIVSSNHMCTLEELDIEKYDKCSDVDSLTSGYASSSNDVTSVDSLDLSEDMCCSSDSERSNSPSDVWRPW